MYKYVTGVIEGTGIGKVSRLPMHIESRIGEPVTLGVEVLNDNNTKPNLSGGTLRFRLLSPVGGHKLYETTAVVTNGMNAIGSITVNLPTGTTVGTYNWDMWFEPASGTRSQIVETSMWKVTSVY
jgi:hypothetical protein